MTKPKLIIYISSTIIILAVIFALVTAIYGKYPAELAFKYSILPILLIIISIILIKLTKSTITPTITALVASLLFINMGYDAILLSHIKYPVYSEQNQVKRLAIPLHSKWISTNLIPNIYKRNDQIKSYPKPNEMLASKSEYTKFINSNKNTKAIVFYKIGCQFCQAAHQSISQIANDKGVSNQVKYVNYESDLGHELEKAYNITRSTTILIIPNNSPATKIQQNIFINGERTLTPNKQLITRTFETLLK